MKSHEICRKLGMTKKALNYYVEKRLIVPDVQENGYREFNDEHLEILKRVVLYRQLDQSISDIKALLLMDHKAALKLVEASLAYHSYQYKQKREWIALMLEGNYEKQPYSIENDVLMALEKAFPGHFGRTLCAHFGVFHFDPIDTPEKKSAFMTMVSYLDTIDVKVPPVLEEIYESMENEVLQQMHCKMKNDVLEGIDSKKLASYENMYDQMKRTLMSEVPDVMSALTSFSTSLKEIFHHKDYEQQVVENMKLLSVDYHDYYVSLSEMSKS